MTTTPAPTPGLSDPLAVRYARQTRNACVFIAWVVAVFALLSLIGGLVLGTSLVHAVNAGNGGGSTSGCMSLGGTDPTC